MLSAAVGMYANNKAVVFAINTEEIESENETKLKMSYLLSYLVHKMNTLFGTQK